MTRSVMISAGHSTVPPRDSGAVGNGYQEADLTLEIRDLVVPIVRSRGVTVKTDGEVGFNDPLTKAIRTARTVDIAVEFHFDGAGTARASGCEGIGHPNRKNLAVDLAAAISRACNIPQHGRGFILPEESHRGKLGFCNAGGVIVEVGFISSPHDVAEYQAKKNEIAESLAAVIVRYATSNAPLGVPGGVGPVRQHQVAAHRRHGNHVHGRTTTAASHHRGRHPSGRA